MVANFYRSLANLYPWQAGLIGVIVGLGIVATYILLDLLNIQWKEYEEGMYMIIGSLEFFVFLWINSDILASMVVALPNSKKIMLVIFTIIMGFPGAWLLCSFIEENKIIYLLFPIAYWGINWMCVAILLCTSHKEIRDS